MNWTTLGFKVNHNHGIAVFGIPAPSLRTGLTKKSLLMDAFKSCLVFHKGIHFETKVRFQNRR